MESIKKRILLTGICLMCLTVKLSAQEESSPVELFYLGLSAYNSGNYALAVNYFQRAAVQGDSSAQNNWGVCLLHGLGVEADVDEAIRWFKASASKDNVESLCNLGYTYYDIISPRDCQQAFHYIKLAVSHDYAPAQWLMGRIWEEGGCIEADLEKAIYWYQKSAQQGDANGLYRLGRCYYKGNGVDQDYVQAVKCYEKAAEQGNVDALQSLALCYQLGKGVEKKSHKAKELYALAAKGGNKAAKRILEFIGLSK